MFAVLSILISEINLSCLVPTWSNQGFTTVLKRSAQLLPEIHIWEGMWVAIIDLSQLSTCGRFLNLISRTGNN